MNPVVHFEIPFDDKEKAKEFYEEVFGWKLQDFPEMSYLIATTTPVDEKTMTVKQPGAINGGLYKRNTSSKNSVIVILVESIDEHLKKVKKAGGSTVNEKVRVADMGWYAQAKDNQGNIIGLWELIK